MAPPIPPVAPVTSAVLPLSSNISSSWILCALEHDPEKWVPVFGKRSCSNKKIERDDDSKKSHSALRSRRSDPECSHILGGSNRYPAGTFCNPLHQPAQHLSGSDLIKCSDAGRCHCVHGFAPSDGACHLRNERAHNLC